MAHTLPAVKRPLLPLVFCLVAMVAAVTAAVADAPPRVFLAGDSTMANKPLDLPERGWGMSLGQFLVDPALVRNHAMNGRSTKSFIDEGRWDTLVAELQPGDFVIIQFAHNDEKTEKPALYTDPATTFRENLRRFVAEARARHATPILATPVCRRKFDVDGQRIDTHGAYPEAVRAVAAEEKVGLLELERLTARWLESEGPECSKNYFMWIEPESHPKIPAGRKDDTHFVEAGATKVAALAVDEMRRLNLPLARWLK